MATRRKKLVSLPALRPHRAVILAISLREHACAIWVDGKAHLSERAKTASGRGFIVSAAQSIATKAKRCLVPVVEYPSFPEDKKLEYRGRWFEQFALADIPSWVDVEESVWRDAIFGRKRSKQLELASGDPRHSALDICQAMRIKTTLTAAEANLIAMWGSQAKEVKALLPPKDRFTQEYVGRVWFPHVIDGGKVS